MRITQAALSQKTAPRLWIVTTNGVSTGAEEVVSPAAAAAWGFGRTVMQERPELRCTLVDVPSQEEMASVLRAEAGAEDGESQIAWREGKRLVARLARVSGAGVSAALRAGTVLITGAFGGLGLLLAKKFAEEGVKHLMLLGRRGAESPGAREEIAALESLGARITALAVEVTDEEALRGALAQIPGDVPLRGVVHAAMVLDDGVLTEQTGARFDRVMAPKVLGALHLDKLTRDSDLDFFILFSSVSGTLGNGGQAAYSAANGFLDGLAFERRRQGLPAQSLAWGPWLETGGAAALSAALQARITRAGLKAVTPRPGIGALRLGASARPEAHLVVTPLDLKSAAKQPASVWRLLVRETVSAEREVEGLAAVPPEQAPGSRPQARPRRGGSGAVAPWRSVGP